MSMTAQWISKMAAEHDVLVYGLVAVLACAEGPILSLIVGVLIRLGLFDFLPVYAVLVAGDLAGDILWYGIGYHFSHRFVRRFGKYVGITEAGVARTATDDFLVFMDADSRLENPDAVFTRALADFEAGPHLVALIVRLKVYAEFETFTDRMMFGVLNFNLRMLNNVFHRGESTGEFQMIRRGTSRLLSLWTLNTLWVFLFDRARNREWQMVR